MLFHGLKQIYCLQQEQSAGAALEAAELRKHTTNDTKCAELGWVCIPLVVESYGAWEREAQHCFF